MATQNQRGNRSSGKSVNIPVKPSDADLIRKLFSSENKERFQIGLDQYGRRIVTVAGQTGLAYQRYIYVNKDGNFAEANADQIIRETKKEYGSNIESLRSSLYRKGFLTEKEYKTRSDKGLSDAILTAANEKTIELVEPLLADPGAEAQLFDMSQWLNTRGDYAGDTGPSDRSEEVTLADSNEMIDTFVVDMLGRNATEAEKRDFYERVTKASKKAVVKTRVSGTKQVQSGSLLTDDDFAVLMAETIKPAVVGTDVEDISKGNGKIAQSITSLKDYASKYGIKLTTKDALDEVMGGMKRGGALTTGDLDQQQQKIRNMSKAFYTNLADSIDNGLNIKSLADQFAYQKSQILETPSESLDVFDKDIQAALRNNGKSGVMSQTDFEVMLRNKPEWGKTKNARQEASGYVNDILKMFGLVG